MPIHPLARVSFDFAFPFIDKGLILPFHPSVRAFSSDLSFLSLVRLDFGFPPLVRAFLFCTHRCMICIFMNVHECLLIVQ